MAYNDDGSRIVCHRSGSLLTELINVWSTGNQAQPGFRIQLPTERRCETFSLDDEGACMVALLTSKSESAIVQCWDGKTGVEMSSLQIEMVEVEGAVFANNNKMLVTGHASDILIMEIGNEIRVWNLEGGCWTLSTTIREDWNAFGVTVYSWSFVKKT